MNHKSDEIDHDPWELIWGQPYIDSERLCSAIEWELTHNLQPDFRTRLLIRDALNAVQEFWGPRKFLHWLRRSPVQSSIKAIIDEKLKEQGFHQIRSRLVTNIRRDQLEQIFDLLGREAQHAIVVYIAGSIPTLLAGLTARPTDDIDFVDEVPAEIRNQQARVDQVEKKYGLTLGHVQSHYLPADWKERAQYWGEFGKIRVYLVDSYDIFLSKLSSKLEKHQDDLRVLALRLDKEKLKERLFRDGKQFLENQHDSPVIEANWQFIFRESLFSGV